MTSDIIRIVIVSANPSSENLRKLLEFEVDFKVIGIIDNGADVLKLVPKLQPDVALIDMNLPDMDGIQVTEKLKNHLPTISIIQIAPHADRDQIHRAMIAGASNFVAGVFQPEQLSTIIRRT